MTASQNASSNAPQEATDPRLAGRAGASASADVSTDEAAALSLPEMLRVLEVARQMREDRQTAEVALRRDEVRTEIRRKLIESAKVTGEQVSDAEVDAAIEQYFDTMHVLKEPKFGLESMLAHAYVLRRRVAAGAAAVTVALALTWYAFMSPWAPLSPTVRAERAAAVQVEQSQVLLQQITSISVDQDATAEASRLMAEVQAAGAANPSVAAAAHQRLNQLWEQMQTQYEVHIVSGGSEMSAFERDFSDDQGTRQAGYYVVVEMRSPEGRVLRQTIRNAETGKQQLVARWAERVPKDVYERLRDDKVSDGVLNETLFAVKRRGETQEQVQIPTRSGEKLQRSAQITNW
ncbi:hypothetical protein Poly24_10800 [Rosistilla carotiformis]|uniref:Uncharacterized protein n=1 Tax=Rosistilla carotiformis TaxID=2528017 RepID=A0A518JPA9_9BACT|nr:DUF6384 family protein [Rosistilla carotiformis]QDV67385.1 hypothetical protein Poly24_10800 [Rosistilla carotiformis]